MALEVIESSRLSSSPWRRAFVNLWTSVPETQGQSKSDWGPVDFGAVGVGEGGQGFAGEECNFTIA